MLNVAIVVPSLATGGAENMAAYLAANVDKSRFCVELLVMSPPIGTYFEQIVRDAGVKTIFFNKEPGFSIKNLWKVNKHLQWFKPGVIHTHMTACVYAVPWALLHGVKVLHTIHNRPVYEAEGGLRRALKFLYRIRGAIPVAISDIIAKETVDLYDISPGLVETIYNPVDLARFPGMPKIKTCPDEVVFANVARFSYQKNHIGLIEAFSRVCKKLPRAKLVLMGDGELKPEIEKKVKQLGLVDRVTFTGIVSDIPQRLAKADIFVLPSHYEGLPVTVLEAMASGLPVIAAAVGGVPDIVKGNGILVEPGNIDDLVNAMNILGRNGQLRQKMAENALVEVKKYDISGVTAQYEQLYERYRKSPYKKNLIHHFISNIGRSTTGN